MSPLAMQDIAQPVGSHMACSVALHASEIREIWEKLLSAHDITAAHGYANKRTHAAKKSGLLQETELVYRIS